MAFTMYDYLDDVTPDYNATLVVNPQGVIYIKGGKEVEVHKTRGRTEERVILSDESMFQIKLQWSALEESEMSTIFDFYNDSSKACGKAYSFIFDMPTQYDSHSYVVRFDSSLDNFLYNYQTYGITNLLLYVLGRIAE